MRTVRSPQPRRTAGRALTTFLTTAALTTAALAAGPLGSASSAPLTTDSEDLTRIDYRGHVFTVPDSWPIVDLKKHPDTCVRFDRHAVYLGSPGVHQNCPARASGRTEALLIQPAPTAPKAVTENPTARTYRATGDRIVVTAAYGYDRSRIQDVLRSAGLPVATARVEAPVKRPAAAMLPADATSYRGEGFDACTAPSQSAMDAWRDHSVYGAIGVYIGGINRACAQQHLTAGWVRTQYARGWRFFPLYVGRQPSSDGGSCGGGCAAITSPVSQGIAAADDAVKQAAALGFGKGTVIYDDLEHYESGGKVTDQVLTYVDAYTERLHALGYRSGAYGNTSSLVADLVANRNEVTLPDVLHFARWNRVSSTSDASIPSTMWSKHKRIHQYVGDTTETHGGVKISIDRDRLDVD
ncbi:glycoside hydrolase domain-containing protein [Streptomyces sp. NPDC002580]|uniref:glycoside hydrolase domain-containing protein n=1 Tax=Streptomyces sp. NPDC002580 TaxID=3364653 RepID=UPI0036891E94